MISELVLSGTVCSGRVAAAPARFIQGVVLIVLVAILLGLTGCASTRGGTISYAVKDFGKPDAPSLTTIEADYRIAPLDKLSVDVFQVKEFTGTYQVDLAGNIALPLIGNVRAIDLTAAQLEEQLKTKLSERYLQKPSVAVGILEAGGSRITLEGAVKQPGLYPVYGRTTLLQAIAMGKGLDEMANAKRVAIFRQIDGRRMAAAFDLTTIRKGVDADPQVYRGDIIVVDGSKARQAWMDTIRSIPLVSLFSPIP